MYFQFKLDEIEIYFLLFSLSCFTLSLSSSSLFVLLIRHCCPSFKLQISSWYQSQWLQHLKQRLLNPHTQLLSIQCLLLQPPYNHHCYYSQTCPISCQSSLTTTTTFHGSINCSPYLKHIP